MARASPEAALNRLQERIRVVRVVLEVRASERRRAEGSDRAFRERSSEKREQRGD